MHKIRLKKQKTRIRLKKKTKNYNWDQKCDDSDPQWKKSKKRKYKKRPGPRRKSQKKGDKSHAAPSPYGKKRKFKYNKTTPTRKEDLYEVLRYSGREQHRPTKEEFQRRVRLCRKLLFTGVPNKDIICLFMSAYNVKERVVWKYIKLAREDLIHESGKPRDEHIADAYAFYTQLKRTSNDDGIRYKAQKEICRLLGLNAPVRISGPTGDGPVQVQHSHLVVSIDDLNLPIEQRRLLLQSMRDRNDPNRDSEGSLSLSPEPSAEDVIDADFTSPIAQSRSDDEDSH